MNFLKKALLLIPFILLSMLLLTSHTTTNSSHATDSTIFTDDFDVALVSDGPRTGGGCNHYLGISMDNLSGDVYGIDVSISKIVYPFSFIPIHYESFGPQDHGNSDYFAHDISDMFQHLDGFGLCCPVAIDMTIYTSNGTFSAFTYQYVNPSCE